MIEKIDCGAHQVLWLCKNCPCQYEIVFRISSAEAFGMKYVHRADCDHQSTGAVEAHAVAVESRITGVTHIPESRADSSSCPEIIPVQDDVMSLCPDAKPSTCCLAKEAC